MNNPMSCCVMPKDLGSECCTPSSCGVFVRQFATSKEESEKLEKYRDELKKELAGVEERLEQLKQKR